LVVATTPAGHTQILGCLIFSYPVVSLRCRDQWIGWDDKARQRRLNLILNNNRFLILPWVKVKNLASKVLSIAVHQVADDWQNHHGYRPVLLETFVDPTRFAGTCYQAANWQQIGHTQGRPGSAQVEPVTAKAVYVYPLTADWQQRLCHGQQPRPRQPASPTTATTPSALQSDDPFVRLWQRITHLVFAVAEEFDQQWRVRRRVIDSRLLMLFIFRLVFAKNKQGYGATIVEVWDQCRAMNIPLPQDKPVAASSFSNARKKLDETIFKTLNERIISAYESSLDEQRWNGLRVFAIDGSIINVPHPLLNQAYCTRSEKAYYPQGLVSCLYQLRSKIPYDYELTAHLNERLPARAHLHRLQPHDLVVYDRGYFSYAMLYDHLRAGIEVVFRLQRQTSKVIDEFIANTDTDQQVHIAVPRKRQHVVRAQRPDIDFQPLPLRLVKYVHDETTYVLGTTLLDRERYPIPALSDLYHSRWGIEELYKVSKVLIDVEDFHAQTERGVKQELYAHFVLITMTRIFANHAETQLNGSDQLRSDDGSGSQQPRVRINLKNSLITVARHLEVLFLEQAKLMASRLNTVMDAICFCRQKERPGRKQPRVSHKPERKWRPAKEKRAPAIA
jgi:hypothetical protein